MRFLVATLILLAQTMALADSNKFFVNEFFVSDKITSISECKVNYAGHVNEFAYILVNHLKTSIVSQDTRKSKASKVFLAGPYIPENSTTEVTSYTLNYLFSKSDSLNALDSCNKFKADMTKAATDAN